MGLSPLARRKGLVGACRAPPLALQCAGDTELRALRKDFRPATDDDRKAFRVPPAYIDAQRNEDPDAALQVVAWSTTTGKPAYFYSPEAKALADAEKHLRVRDLGARIDTLIPLIEEGCARDFQPALVLRLILQTGMRNGNPPQGKVKNTESFGATSLLCEHTLVKADNTVAFAFPGKHGVVQELELVDGVLHSWIVRRKFAGAKRLFDCETRHVLAYLRKIGGEHLKVHDLRTWYANLMAVSAAKLLESETLSPKDRRKVMIGAVAKTLGNTPGAAKGAYIAPELLEEEDG